MSGRTPFFSAWLDQWEEYAADLPVHRVLYAITLLMVLPRALWVKNTPDGLLFPPPGLPTFLPAPPVAWAVDLVNAALVALALVLASGRLRRIVPLGIAALLLLLGSWSYAFGKINHELLVIALPLILAFSGWSNRDDGGDGTARGGAWPLALLALMVALAMSTAAHAKATGGWLYPETSASRFHVLQNHVVTGRSGPLTETLLGWDAPLFWEISDLATIGMEYAFLPALLSPLLFRLACLAALAFHVGTWLSMDIAFTNNVIVYGAFVRWSRVPVVGRITRAISRAISGERWAGGWGRRAPLLPVLMVAVVAAAAYTIWQEQAAMLSSRAGRLILPAGAAIAAALVVRSVASALREEARARRKEARARRKDAVLLFDGVCNLCNRWVDLLVRLDRSGALRLASLQSGWARVNAARVAMPNGVGGPASVVLLVGDRRFIESRAIIHSLTHLGGWKRSAGVLLLVPDFLRDGAYRWIARNRYRLFGQRAECRIPDANERQRFLE